MELIVLFLLVWVFGWALGFSGPSISVGEVVANIAAAIGGGLILAFPVVTVGWIIYRIGEWVQPAPGGALAAAFVVAFLFGPILALLAWSQLFGAIIDYGRRKNAWWA